MKAKTIYFVAISFLFVMVSLPLYASEYRPMSEPTFIFEKWVTQGSGESEGIADTEGLSARPSSGEKELCFHEWETKALGDRMVAACVHPRQNDRYGG